MTNQSTIDKLIEMRLTAMADAFRMFFVKRFSLKKASEFPVFSKGFSLL